MVFHFYSLERFPRASGTSPFCVFFAGIGIGGEWAMGGTFVAEAWPEKRRAAAPATCTRVITSGFSCRLANSWIGARYGWRAMFLLGGAPALLVALMRYGVEEPERWREKVRVVRAWSLWRPFAELFSPDFADGRC